MLGNRDNAWGKQATGLVFSVGIVILQETKEFRQQTKVDSVADWANSHIIGLTAAGVGSARPRSAVLEGEGSADILS